jgi:CRP-like cAMP-binding protein
MTDARVEAALRRTGLFSEVPDVASLAAVSRLRTVRRGQVLFSAGDPGDSLIVVISGRIKVVVHSADGGELTLTIVGAGGVLGELSVADGGSRSTDAETLEDSELLFVPRAEVRAVCLATPAAAAALTASVAASLRRLTEATADLVFLDLPRRVAKMLLEAPQSSPGVVSLGLSQEELAHLVGGTRQSVNAALRGFERRGWVELRDRSVVVRREADLARFAGVG